MAITITADTPEDLQRTLRGIGYVPVQRTPEEQSPEDVGTWLKPGTLREEPTDLTEQVQAFMHKFEFQDRMDYGPTSPATLAVKEVGFRLGIIVEEFIEVVDAFGVSTSGWMNRLRQALLDAQSDESYKHANLNKIAHELGDLDYAVEGARITFGIPRIPIGVAIHRANMAKARNPVDGAIIKPLGWQSAEEAIERVLARERARSE